jgi:nicotinate-nucleotide pyrophosphorylase (carboxylating)
MLAPLPDVMLEPMVRAALLEDLGRAGDITSGAIVPADLRARATLASRAAGVVAGVDLARLAFRLIDPSAVFEVHRPDGSAVGPGESIATVHGAARGVLTAERVALNYLSHLSGIATATAGVVAAVAGLATRVVCTRKTIPGLRALQKYAVRAGGGSNHRFGLDDAVLIKDNHIALAGGVAVAVQRARAGVGHLVKIELEVDTLDQLETAIGLGIDAVLLDNMDVPTLRRAVRMVGRRMLTEASGGITPDNAAAVAAAGVDMISLGWLTHSSQVLDIGLDIGRD